MTINGIIENQIVNNNAGIGKTNREMYNFSRIGNFEMYWFSFDGENDLKSTSFAKAKNYTVAHLDNWGSGEIDNYVKIDNAWYYVTKELLTRLFDPNDEGTDEENENYVEDNIIGSEEIRTDILNNVQRIIINGFYDRWFTITNINGYEILMKIHQFNDCVGLICCIDNKDNGVCLMSCDEYCEHTLHLKDYTKEELYDTITEYFYNKYCLFTYMIDDIKAGVMTESLNCYNYGFEFAGDCEETFGTMCDSFKNETDEENKCINKCEYKLYDAEKEILDYVENGENDSEIELIQPALNVKIRVFKHYDGVCGIIVDSMIPAVDTFKLNDVDIDDVRYFVTDHNGIVDFDWLNNAIGITVEANERFIERFLAR